jgi:hypothetical protein
MVRCALKDDFGVTLDQPVRLLNIMLLLMPIRSIGGVCWYRKTDQE